MLEVSKLVKRYGKQTAVCGLDFTAERGEILGLLGPNGAGKSTTMNMLTGYLAPTSGEILVGGVDLQKDPAKVKARIGYMPEVPPLYQDMTVKEYLIFVAELKKIPRREKKKTVEDLMEKTSVTKVANRLIKNLSKGYRQRVGFAQAIMGDPDIIILDEPTAGLDPRQIRDMREMILGLKKDHLVILSSHILSEIQEVCDHVLIISNGKLVLSDTTEHLLDEHQESLEDVFLALTEQEDLESPEEDSEKDFEEDSRKTSEKDFREDLQSEYEEDDFDDTEEEKKESEQDEDKEADE
ncbi:MAG: ABC transporter ATP-binding protein [Lachnospiraceae bacterium]|nr:ABC transporter ATP-binding protein [Lachnospiraceae bacterium]